MEETICGLSSRIWSIFSRKIRIVFITLSQITFYSSTNHVKYPLAEADRFEFCNSFDDNEFASQTFQKTDSQSSTLLSTNLKLTVSLESYSSENTDCFYQDPKIRSSTSLF